MSSDSLMRGFSAELEKLLVVRRQLQSLARDIEAALDVVGETLAVLPAPPEPPQLLLPLGRAH